MSEEDNKQEHTTAVMPSMPTILSTDWARFGQWAIILGVLVWVLQVFIGTIQETEEANRQERTEMREMYHRAMDDRLEALERALTHSPAPVRAGILTPRDTPPQSVIGDTTP